MRKLSLQIALAVLATCLFVLPTTNVFAAEVNVEFPTTPVGVGDSFLVPITFDTQGESINALEGDLHYAPDTLTLKEIRDGNSIINLWLERPADTNGTIHFAGITPGGYAGDSGELFTLVFEARKAGSAYFSLTDAQALLNDGAGTKTSIRLHSSVIAVARTGSGIRVGSLVDSDHAPPEVFVPTVGSDPAFFDGVRFVVFATQDKGSGIDHYEVAEKNKFPAFFFDHLDWREATSPYVLPEQDPYAYVYVKAFDKAGNVRVAVLSPKNLPLYYNMNVLLAILVILVLLGGRIYAHYRGAKRYT